MKSLIRLVCCSLSVFCAILLLADRGLAESKLPDAPTAATKASAPLRIAVITSLSGFAASYGQSVLEGIQLAVAELKKEGISVELLVEDDSSQSNQTFTAYQSLKSRGKIDALITGSWWVRNLVQITERDQIPFLSVETVYDRDFVFSPNYFVIGGDLREWIAAYDPLFASKGWKRAAIVHFISGFGYTLADALRARFDVPGRAFAGAVEYQDVEAAQAGMLILRAKKLDPDVVYLDGQPQSVVGFIKKRAELGLSSLPIIGNTTIKNSIEQGLIPVDQQDNLYFTQRSSAAPAFEDRFVAKYGKKPQLNADLGYYGTMIFARNSKAPDLQAAIRNSVTEIDGVNFSFNKDNVLQGLVWKVYAVNSGKITPAE